MLNSIYILQSSALPTELSGVDITDSSKLSGVDITDSSKLSGVVAINGQIQKAMSYLEFICILMIK